MTGAAKRPTGTGLLPEPAHGTGARARVPTWCGSAETNQEWQVLHLRVHTFAACAVVNLQQLPEKLNPVIKPLMEAIRKEENTLVQNYVASCIAKLLQQCTTRSPCPNSKIIKNLCNSLCVDPHLTPLAACPAQPQSGNENSKGPNSDKDGMHHTVTKHKGIITLYRHQKAAFSHHESKRSCS